MGWTYILRIAKIFIDGRPEPLAQLAPGDFVDGLASIDTKIEAGDHFITLEIVYDGAPSVLQGYKFTVRSSHRFDAIAGETRQIRVTLCERGSQQTPFTERPAVDFADGGP